MVPIIQLEKKTYYLLHIDYPVLIKDLTKVFYLILQLLIKNCLTRILKLPVFSSWLLKYSHTEIRNVRLLNVREFLQAMLAGHSRGIF